jgi:hypothetical protein
MAERLVKKLHQKQRKRRMISSLKIREPQMACLNLELPADLQGRSSSFPPNLYTSLKYRKYRVMNSFGFCKLLAKIYFS